MKKLIFILIVGSLFAENDFAINSEWTGLFPSLNLEYKFKNTQFKYNIVRFGVGKIKSDCSGCGGKTLFTDGY